MKAKVTHYDNRGTPDYPFGFVYFSDGKRVVYSKGAGVTDGTGGWGAITPTHVKVATDFLSDLQIL